MSTTTLDDIVVMVGADPQKAKHHGDNYILHDDKGMPFSVCKSTTEELGVGGIGIEMYFVFLKQMVILFAVMTVISFPILIFNYIGGYLNTIDKTSPFEASTIANQKGIPTGTTSRSEAEQALNDHKKFMYSTIILDILYSAAFLIMIYIFQCYNKRRVRTSINMKVGDYSIVVELPVGVEATEEELKTFFEKYGAVTECVIPKCFGPRLKTYTKYIHSEKKLMAEIKKVSTANNEKADKVDELRKKCNDILQKIRETQQERPPILYAFIIFESIKSKLACLRDYNRAKANSLDKQPAALRLRGHPLIVAKAPEPQEINWPNYGMKRSSWKKLILYVAIAFLMLGSLLSISIVEYYEKKMPTYSKCLGYDVLVDPTNSTEEATQEKVICFCGGLDESEVIFPLVTPAQ
ncbi:MAG: hypothetical protein P4M11_06710 [Candidatus Pacebacteria bacterium]|nr:hypothetical protein [Candidatus Paceibacterota bacterium]